VSADYLIGPINMGEQHW